MMTFPPETAQDYCDYFQDMVLNAKPPDPKWETGLKASQMWRDYCETEDVSEHSQVLIPLIKILMPVRQAGSGLLDLWQQILRQVTKLPVREQREIWFAVFNVVNQGEYHVKHNDAALQILQEWIKLDSEITNIPVDKNIMTDIVNKVYLYTFSGYEWIIFTTALSEWFKEYIEGPSLYDAVCSKFEKKPD